MVGLTKVELHRHELSKNYNIVFNLINLLSCVCTCKILHAVSRSELQN